MVAELKLTDRGDRRRRAGELWLDRRDVRDDTFDGSNGSVVDLTSPEGHFRGRGFYSAKSDVAVRIVSGSKATVDEQFFRDRIRAALQYRQRRCSDRMSYRVVHGDGDYLPGLVVDRYGEYLIVQFRHPTIENFRETIGDILEDELNPRSIYCRNDFHARKTMGLEQTSGRLRGEELPSVVTVQENPFTMMADLKEGQKTGHYLDQAFNRRAFGRYLTDEKGLDCFSYSGGWGLEALARGAGPVTFVDSSERALELVEENLRRNDWTDRADLVEADAFDYLNDRSEEGTECEFIVLDPPAFARRPESKDRALGGYKEINLRAMQILREGGLLASSSCSTPVTRNDFLGVIQSSADDAHVNCRVLEERSQGPDHPWLPKLPATLYLQSMICEISLR